MQPVVKSKGRQDARKRLLMKRCEREENVTHVGVQFIYVFKMVLPMWYDSSNKTTV